MLLKFGDGVGTMVQSPKPVTDTTGATKRGTGVVKLTCLSKYCFVAPPAPSVLMLFRLLIIQVSPPHLLPPEKVEPQKLSEDQKRRVEVGVEVEETCLDRSVDKTSRLCGPHRLSTA
jgi:hypothetical protein